MLTTSQLIRKGRKKILKKTKVPALQGCPQRKGICDSFSTTTPKKPNSALRKVARITLTTGQKVKVYIIGENGGTPPVQEHNSVLVRGGKTRDLPGFRLRVVRGAEDVAGVVNRQQGRSKYGTKRDKKK